MLLDQVSFSCVFCVLVVHCCFVVFCVCCFTVVHNIVASTVCLSLMFYDWFVEFALFCSLEQGRFVCLFPCPFVGSVHCTRFVPHSIRRHAQLKSYKHISLSTLYQVITWFCWRWCLITTLFRWYSWFCYDMVQTWGIIVPSIKQLISVAMIILVSLNHVSHIGIS